MPALNPDFSRRADDITAPPNPIFGWTDGQTDIKQAVLRERLGAERLHKDVPIMMRVGAIPEPLPKIVKQFNDFQKSKGRYEGSYDWSLLDEFVLQQTLIWLPQIIGSCVVSNTFRGWVTRLMYQITFLGMPQEYLGRNQFGPLNYAFYGPWTYGAARIRGNMARGGDGLYCEAMVESLLKDGVMSCGVPALIELLKQLGSNNEKDFPEPQNAAVYRAFGSGKYVEQLRKYADFTLESCPYVTDADQLITMLKAGMPTFHCSNLAIKKIGTHKDGFAIHGRDPGNSWPHNMEFVGFFIASDGELFFVFSNESWGLNYVYNVPYKEVQDWFARRNVTAAAIGMIRGPASSLPLVA